MANTYIPIQTTVVSSPVASVTLSGIPQTYTDLVLRISGKTTQSGTDSLISVRFNGDTNSLYSATVIYSNGSSAVSTRNSNTAQANNGTQSATWYTGDPAWGSAEYYIPNYTVSQNRPFNIESAAETESSSSNIWYINGMISGLYRSTTAISSITLGPFASGANWVAGSSFYLYGIS